MILITSDAAMDNSDNSMNHKNGFFYAFLASFFSVTFFEHHPLEIRHFHFFEKRDSKNIKDTFILFLKKTFYRRALPCHSSNS